MAKKNEIETTFNKLSVRLANTAPRHPDGLEIFKQGDIPRGFALSVLGTYMHSWGKGEYTPCFLIALPPGGEIVGRACELFRVVEIDGEEI